MTVNAPGTTCEHPENWEPGETAKDIRTGRVGRVMGRVGPRYQLRPLNGGKEWEAAPDHLSPAIQSDALSDAVAEVNARTRSGL